MKVTNKPARVTAYFGSPFDFPGVDRLQVNPIGTLVVGLRFDRIKVALTMRQLDAPEVRDWIVNVLMPRRKSSDSKLTIRVVS